MSLIKRPNSSNWYYLFQIQGRKYFGSTQTPKKTLARRHFWRTSFSASCVVRTPDVDHAATLLSIPPDPFRSRFDRFPDSRHLSPR